MTTGVDQGRREPAFRAPWPAVAIAVAILAAYLVQSRSGVSDAIIARWGFSAASLAYGHWRGLATALFVHGSWAHAGMNAVGALAFGAPVARLFGGRPLGVLSFFGFYLGCGVLASLGFALVNPGSEAVLVGASGAVSGLMGAASRLLVSDQDRTGEGDLAPYLSRGVVGMAIGWIVVNLLMAVFGSGVEVGGAPVAWQAHLFGYAAGVAGVGPLSRWLNRR